MLKEMSEKPEGYIVVPEYFGASESESERRHHADLLVDSDLANWKSEDILRITDKGYDFLNIIETDKQKYLEQIKRSFDKGAPFLKVVNYLVSIANNIQI